MQDRLGVAAGSIAVTALLQPGPQVGVVVDFAIVDDPHRSILVGHRLTASEHIHNREPAHPQAHRSLDPQPLAVGPAVAQHVPHPLETRLVHGVPLVQFDDPHDPAHALVLNLARQNSSGAISRRAPMAAGVLRRSSHRRSRQAHGARDVPLRGSLRDRDTRPPRARWPGLVSLLLPRVGCASRGGSSRSDRVRYT